jgi:hypothetical protein
MLAIMLVGERQKEMGKVSQHKVYEVFWSQSAMTWNKQGSTFVASDAGPEWASQVFKKQLKHESSLDQTIMNWRIDDVVEDPDGSNGLVYKAE